MIGTLTKDVFDPGSNYEHFYEHHKFQPFALPFDCHEVLPRAAWTLDTANEMKAESMLDLCCLDGFVSLTVAKHCPTMKRVVGVDLSEPGINRANELSTQVKGAKFVQTSVEDYLNSTIAMFDMILMFEAVEHFIDTPLVIELAKQHLNPGGRILISTPDLDGVYGDSNDDACHLRVYTYKKAKDAPAFTKLNKPVVSLPDEVKALGGTVVDNEVWNDLVHVSATFS